MKHIQEPGSRQNFFACRYDWQTLLYREGGAMRNNAAHTIEQIMDLAGSDELPESHSCMEIWNSVGDAEDYMFATMKYSNGTVYEEFCGRRGGLHVRHHEVFQRHCVRGGGQLL